MMTAYLRRDWNHPSILIWSMENEVLICTNTKPDMYESNRKNLIALGQRIGALDPTRPIVFDGDADVDGTWSTMNLHYPRWWHHHPDLPNSAFWLSYGKADLPCDQSYPFRVTWDRPKPIVFGEDGLYVAATIPHDMSSLGGDAAYRAVHDNGYFGAQSIDDRGHAMLIEGYRDAEVSIVTNMLGGTEGPACAEAHRSVRCFVLQRDSRFFAGDRVTRNINLHQDMLQSADVITSFPAATF